MIKNNKSSELTSFLSDIIASKIIRLDTNTNDELNTLKMMKELKLDFDDTIQYYLCEKYNLKIVSYDRHFDNTHVERLEPDDLL